MSDANHAAAAAKTEANSPSPSRRALRRALSAVGFLLFLCLLAAMIAVSTYSGFQSGQQERNVRSTGTANAYLLERFQRGLDEMGKGNYILAQANFEEVLRYQPGNAGVQNLIATAIVAQTPTPTPVPPTPTPVVTDKGALLRMIEDASEQQDWDAVIRLGDQLRALDSAYQAERAGELRYEALVKRGVQRLNDGDLEAGLYDLDIASDIQPLDGQVESLRQIAARYQNAMYFFGADWAKAIELLTELYRISPGYRDVAAKLLEAYVRSGDAYAGQLDWCPAEQRYTSALELAQSARIDSKRADAQQRCLTATVMPISGTFGMSATMQVGPGMYGRLAFSAFDPAGGYYQLYLYDSAGNRVQTIEPGGMQPSFHRGGVLVYTAGSAVRGYYSSGAVANLFNGAAAWPSLSPDAQRLAYAAMVDGAWRIFVVPLDGSSPPQDVIAGSYPAWGPTGLIAFQGCPDGNCGIYTINPDQPSDLRRISTSAGDISMQWSPDGNALVYMTNFTGAWEIYKVYLSGQFQQLTSLGAQSAAPAWSPDGSSIAFESNKDGNWAIYVMNADGSNLRKLADIGAQHPSWQTERLAWGQ